MNFHPVHVHTEREVRSCKHADRCSNCKVRVHSICAALQPDELCELDALAHPAHFAPKHTLFVEGDPQDSVYTVTGGAVRLYKMLPDGRRQIVGFALPGDFLGLALAERHEYSADAVGAVTLCRFPRAAFIQLIERKPHLLRRLHEFAALELHAAQEQMTLLGRRSADEKIASFLLVMQTRWNRLNGPSVTVPLPMSRQDIADFLGLTIETVSRGFTRLAREKKILNVPDGVRLIDSKSLGAAAA